MVKIINVFSLIRQKQSFINDIKLEIYSTLSFIAAPFFLLLSVYYFIQNMPVLGSMLFQIFLVLLLDAIWIKRHREMIISYQIVYVVEFITLIYGCTLLGEMALFWAYPLCLSMIFIVSHHYIKFFLILSYVVATTAAYLIVDTEECIHFGISLFILCLICYYLEKMFIKSEKTLLNIVHRDPLTNAYNAMFMDDLLDRVVSEMDNKGHAPSSLIVVSISDFQDLNAKIGFKAADQVLIEIVNNVQSQLRKTDYLFRLGGVDFMILQKNTTKSQALDCANKLSSLLEAISWDNNYDISSHIAVTEYRNQETVESWLDRTGEYLVNAKMIGPNTVFPTKDKLSEEIYSPYSE